MRKPERMIQTHGGYRKIKSFQVVQLAISESRALAALLPKLRSPEVRVPKTLGVV